MRWPELDTFSASEMARDRSPVHVRYGVRGPECRNASCVFAILCSHSTPSLLVAPAAATKQESRQAARVHPIHITAAVGLLICGDLFRSQVFRVQTVMPT